ncbi:uncharacterized protein LOC111891335 [Lactuca sativa]|uniref:Uncharacterized protein n=1 Tax=Lactuca sativa TaxID=4236 RepID=A0A9R1XAW1_LACSA|nr:uncharacterized protein LOC111891335 [Lactuca sativa]XP_023743159.1 uncharacterized protein LOC111891335 [Lactuca sativa]KAJ0205524.1 hypothetical protein LSAT_V11C500252810 [Lactuca sativa]
MAGETHTRTHMSTVGVFALKVRFVFRILQGLKETQLGLCQVLENLMFEDHQGESDETRKGGSVALGECKRQVSRGIGCTNGSFFPGVSTASFTLMCNSLMMNRLNSTFIFCNFSNSEWTNYC